MKRFSFKKVVSLALVLVIIFTSIGFVTFATSNDLDVKESEEFVVDETTEESEYELTELESETKVETQSESETSKDTDSEVESGIEEVEVEEEEEEVVEIEGNYISDVKMVFANKDAAKEIFKENGYIMIDVSLNGGSISDTEIYLGYKKTDDENEAIRGLGERWFSTSGKNKESYVGEYEKYNFTAVTDFDGNAINTNEGYALSGKFVYLYMTRDKNAGAPITQIEVLIKHNPQSIEKLQDNNKYKAVVNSNNGELANFNRGKSGNLIYIRYMCDGYFEEEEKEVVVSRDEWHNAISQIDNIYWLEFVYDFKQEYGDVIYIKDGIKLYGNGLVTVSIPHNVIFKLPENSEKYFAEIMPNVKSIKGLDLLDTSDVVSMRQMFFDCKSVKEIYGLNKWDTSKVEDMDSMFSCCSRLKSIDLTSFDTSNVKTMKWMFNYCEVLSEIKGIENFDVNNVSDMIGMFKGCASIKSLDFKEFDVSKLEKNFVLDMFTNCIQLQIVYINNTFKKVSETLKAQSPKTQFINNFSVDENCDEEEFVKDVKLVVANKNEAKKVFDENGYVMIETNLNEGSSGKEIYLGYSITTKKDEAIRGLGERWFSQDGKSPESYIGEYYEYNYSRVTDFDGNILNTNHGGNSYAKYVYLYMTKDKNAGEPILEIEVLATKKTTKDKLTEDNKWKVVENSNNGSLANFNRGLDENKAIYIRYRDDSDEIIMPKTVYIKDVKLIERKDKDVAEQIFNENGYIMIPTNLNMYRQVYLGYSITTKKDEAITGLGERWFNGINKNPTSYVGDYHKYNYFCVTGFDNKQFRVNTNSTAKSLKYVYLYATKDKNAGEPIKEIEILNMKKTTRDRLIENNKWKVVENSNNGELADFSREGKIKENAIYIRYR